MVAATSLAQLFAFYLVFMGLTRLEVEVRGILGGETARGHAYSQYVIDSQFVPLIAVLGWLAYLVVAIVCFSRWKGLSLFEVVAGASLAGVLAAFVMMGLELADADLGVPAYLLLVGLIPTVVVFELLKRRSRHRLAVA